jgi:hypothetical protein
MESNTLIRRLLGMSYCNTHSQSLAMNAKKTILTSSTLNHILHIVMHYLQQ